MTRKKMTKEYVVNHMVWNFGKIDIKVLNMRLDIDIPNLFYYTKYIK